MIFILHCHFVSIQGARRRETPGEKQGGDINKEGLSTFEDSQIAKPIWEAELSVTVERQSRINVFKVITYQFLYR